MRADVHTSAAVAVTYVALLFFASKFTVLFVTTNIATVCRHSAYATENMTHVAKLFKLFLGANNVAL